jgi:hypothetical protein
VHQRDEIVAGNRISEHRVILRRVEE